MKRWYFGMQYIYIYILVNRVVVAAVVVFSFNEHLKKRNFAESPEVEEE